jgi:hypothetical protein
VQNFTVVSLTQVLQSLRFLDGTYTDRRMGTGEFNSPFDNSNNERVNKIDIQERAIKKP